MKTSHIWAMLLIGAGFAACTNDTFVEEPSAVEVGENTTIKEITVTLPQIEGSEEFATTRTEFVMDADGVKAHWAAGDTIGIFPAKGDQVSFPITGGTETNTATFDGGDWGLKAGRSYAAYFPYDKWNIFRNNKTVLMDYTGQVQTGNNNYSHLGAYDFLAAGQVNPNSAGYLTLEMQRLGSIVKLELTLPESFTPTGIELTSDQNSFVTKAILDVSSSSPVVSVLEESSTFTLGIEDGELGYGGSYNHETGVGTEYWDLTTYMMLSPVAFKTGGSTWSVRVNADDGRYYIGEIETKDLEANKPYKFESTLEAALPTLRNANLIAAAEVSAGQQFAKNTDGTVTLNEANMAIVEAVTTLDLSRKNDPTVCDEIGYFVNLEELNCEQNYLTSLNVSNNSSLISINCSLNQLASLDITNNSSLVYINCTYNKLTSLDISKNFVLTYLDCSGNQLSSLDVSHNTDLYSLKCKFNNLSMLDVTNNTLLTVLWCDNNHLTSLDLSQNTALKDLECHGNQISILDVTNNTLLTGLACAGNLLTSLDVSKNISLSDLNCSYNQLTSLDVSANKSLYKLDCSGNQLISLDLSYNTGLIYLYCNDNQLLSLNVFNNINLWVLYCYCNQLSSLDISMDTKLKLSGVQVGNQPGDLTLYVNGTQSSQSLASENNNNVTIVLKDDGGATNPDPGDWN